MRQLIKSLENEIDDAKVQVAEIETQREIAISERDELAQANLYLTQQLKSLKEDLAKAQVGKLNNEKVEEKEDNNSMLDRL